MPTNLENSAVATGLERVSFHSNPKESARECSNYHTIALISHASKLILRILQVRLQQSFQMFKLDLEKAEGPEIKLPTSVGSQKKQENPRKTSTSASLTMLKPLTVWLTTKCGKFFKRWEYQTTLPASCLTCMQVKKQEVELDMEQWNVSKLGKECVKTVYCHTAYLTCVQSTSHKMPSWMKPKQESRFSGEISTASDMQMTLPLWQKVRRNKRAS